LLPRLCDAAKSITQAYNAIDFQLYSVQVCSQEIGKYGAVLNRLLDFFKRHSEPAKCTDSVKSLDTGFVV